MCENCDNSPVFDARCIFYNPDSSGPSQLLCFLGIENDTSLHDILEKIDSKLCDVYNPTVLSCFREKAGLEDETYTLSEFLIALQQYLCDATDVFVKVSSTDTTSGYLFDKIQTENCIIKSIFNQGGVQSLRLSLDYQCLVDSIPEIITVDASQCYNVTCPDCGPVQCTPTPLLPVINYRTVGGITTLTCNNCNGTVQWYNSTNQTVGVGYSINVSPGDSYRAKSFTYCGESGYSNVATIPQLSTYSVTKSTVFIKNNCGDNGCGKACTGTNVQFSKTYNSYISQSHAQSLANSDSNYPMEGQTYANANGACVCPSCNCVSPLFTNNTVNNPTCLGSVLQSNGSVNILGITNANKFGVAYNTNNYNGPNYSSAYNLGVSTGNIISTNNSITITGLDTQKTIIIRLFNQENGCFKDLFFTLNTPSCGTSPIIFNSLSISCNI